jgi:hypothetical protein
MYYIFAEHKDGRKVLKVELTVFDAFLSIRDLRRKGFFVKIKTMNASSQKEKKGLVIVDRRKN